MRNTVFHIIFFVLSFAIASSIVAPLFQNQDVITLQSTPDDESSDLENIEKEKDKAFFNSQLAYNFLYYTKKIYNLFIDSLINLPANIEIDPPDLV